MSGHCCELPCIVEETKVDSPSPRFHQIEYDRIVKTLRMHEATMDLETGILTAMAIGILGAGVLTAWCFWSRYQELEDLKNR